MNVRIRSVWVSIVGALALLVAGIAPGVAAGPPGASAGANARQEVPARLVRLTGDPAPGAKGEAARGRPDTAYVLVGGQRIPVALTLIRGVPAGAVLVRLSAPVAGDDAAVAAALARGTVTVASVRVDPGERHGTDVGEHHLLVVPVYWQSSTTDAGELAQNFGAMADYFKRNTNAKITLAPATIMAPQKITLTTTQKDECDYTAIESKVRAITGSTPHDRFHHIIAVMENLPSCWWGGLATLGPSDTGDGFIWVNGYPIDSLLAHELGHNLDLTHSGALWCFDAKGKRVPLSDTCRSTTYDDPWDVMGNQPYGFGRSAHPTSTGSACWPREIASSCPAVPRCRSNPSKAARGCDRWRSSTVTPATRSSTGSPPATTGISTTPRMSTAQVSVEPDRVAG